MIESCDDLVDRLAKVHWHFTERRYSVSLKAENGNWYVVRNKSGHQLYFGKLVMANVTFRVQPAAAKRAYETGKRNVHATVIGTVVKAQFERESAIVPCGRPVLYSHNLYPEPEFKVQDVNPCGIPVEQWEGIEWAEMLACGAGSMSKSPNILATGRIRTTLKGGD